MGTTFSPPLPKRVVIKFFVAFCPKLPHFSEGHVLIDPSPDGLT